MSTWDRFMAWFHYTILDHAQAYGREDHTPEMLQRCFLQCDCGEEWFY